MPSASTLNKSLTLPDLEKVYDLLAEAIDAVPADKTELLLVKLALLLAQDLGDRERFAALTVVAKRDL